MVSGCVSVGKLGDSEIFRLTQCNFINLRSPAPDDDMVSDVSVFHFLNTYDPCMNKI